MNTEVIFPDNGAIQGMLLGIAVLFGFGVWQWWKAHTRLSRELAAARRLLGSTALKLSVNSAKVLLGKDHASLPGRLITAMVNHNGLAFARPADALEPALDEVGRINAAARTVPNLLLLAGLVTTVVGLIYTLVSLGPQIKGAIEAANPAEVSQALGMTLQEMSAAFAGTFWGVALALVLQGLNAWSGIRAGQLSGELDAVSTQFAPLVYPAGTEKQLQSLQDLVSRTEEFLSQTHTAIVKTSEDFARVLTQAGSVIEASLKTLQSTSQEVAVALKTASGDVKVSSDRLNKAVETMQQHRQDYRNIYSQFNDMFTQSMAALREHSDSQLGEIRTLQANFDKSGAQIIERLLDVGSTLHSVGDQLAFSQGEYAGSTEMIAGTIRDGFVDLYSNIGSTLSRYTTEVNTVGQHFETLSKQLEGTAQASQHLQRALIAKDDAEVTRARDQQQQQGVLVTRLQELRLTLETLQPQLNALQTEPQWAAALGTSMQEAGQQAQQSRASLLAQLQLLGEQLRPPGTTELQQQMAQVNTLLEGMLDQLSGFSDAAPQQAAILGEVRESAVQSREAAERIRQLLEALPGHLAAGALGDLRRSQEALGDRLSELTRALTAVTAETPQAAEAGTPPAEVAGEPSAPPVGGPAA